MAGLRRLIQFFWLAITFALVVLYLTSDESFKDSRSVAVFLGLIALFVKALQSTWRWADLVWRKAWLWTLNSSVNWTLEVRVEVERCIEEADIVLLLQEVREARNPERVFRLANSDTIIVETQSGYRMTVRPMDNGDHVHWVLRFDPVHIGYRDATHVLARVFVPVIESVTRKIPEVAACQYAIEARFSAMNPYAAVLLNELRVKSADRVLLSFAQDGSVVQLTKDSVISSSANQADALHAMSTVFGLSLRGAFGAGHV